ncbi:MAG: hypothetical protein WBQ94_25650 [Terracidiphilus sp.]
MAIAGPAKPAGSDDRQYYENPFRTKHPKTSLSDVISNRGYNIGYQQSAEHRIAAKGSDRNPITLHKNQDNQNHSNRAQIEPRLKIAIVRLIDAGIFVVHVFQARPSPEGFEARTNNRVRIHLFQNLPDFSSAGKIGTPSHRIHDSALDVEKVDETATKQNDQNERVHSRGTLDPWDRKHQRSAEYETSTGCGGMGHDQEIYAQKQHRALSNQASRSMRLLLVFDETEHLPQRAQSQNKRPSAQQILVCRDSAN